VAESDCFLCSEGKVLSASPFDNIGKCVEYLDVKSCERGYRVT
jgi:hypothetical protein